MTNPYRPEGTSPDAVELVKDANGFFWRKFKDGTFSMCPTNPDNSPIPRPLTHYADLAVLLQDSGEAGVRLHKVSCKECEGSGALGYYPPRERCSTCQGQGYSYRVAVLEHHGGWYGESIAEAQPVYRDKPTSEEIRPKEAE